MRLPSILAPGARRILGAGALLACGWILAGCADQDHQIVISVPEQRMVLIKDGIPLAIYPVSTSKFGLGDRPGSSETPLGTLEVARKIGGGEPPGTVFKSREPTGEIVAVDSPGRDPIVSRILWLRGLDAENQHAYDRFIYIHGTARGTQPGPPRQLRLRADALPRRHRALRRNRRWSEGVHPRSASPRGRGADARAGSRHPAAARGGSSARRWPERHCTVTVNLLLTLLPAES